MGLDAETGVFMLLFLDLAHDEAAARGRLRTTGDLVEAIVHGAVKRVRPKAMTVFAAFMGLLPIMWSTGTGADVMKRIAAPMVGGLVTSFILELLVYPAVYYLWKGRGLAQGPATAEPAGDPAHAKAIPSGGGRAALGLVSPPARPANLCPGDRTELFRIAPACVILALRLRGADP
jgi:Cu(I)/Ag(I) efflux system membrane protein CusA/SilA